MIEHLSTQVAISILDSERTASASRVTLTVRELIEALTGPDAYQVRGAKEGGGAWSPIVWRDDTRDSAGAESVSCLVYDLDHASPEDLAALGDRLDASGLIYATHETHTAGRFRLVFPLASPLAPSTYPGAWRGLLDSLAIPGVDLQCADLARLFYLPARPPDSERLSGSGGTRLYDPPVAITPVQPERNVAEARDGKPESPKGESPKIFDLDGIRQAIKDSSLATDLRRSLQDAIDQRLVLHKGERENALHRLTCGLVSAFPEGVSKPDAEVIVESVFTPLVERMERDAGETTEYFLSRVGSSFDRAWEHREVRLAKRKAVREAAEKFLKPPEGDPSAWRSRLLQQESKAGPRVRSCTSNLDLILENDEAFKGYLHFDELTRSMGFTGGALYGSNLSTVGLQLSNWLQTSPYALDIAETVCGRALLLATRRHARNPVAEYLEGLVWDGVPRIHEVLTRHCAAEGNKQYVQEITRKFFISAAARGLMPGCKVDTVLVLQGPQGTKKTSFVEALAGSWYTTVSGKTDDKDTRMQATSAWFVELSELASMGKSSVESLRGFLTQRVDHIRLPYAAAHEEFARRCVFVGTTNSEQPLIDQEGNRRFWVVTCGRIDLPEIERVRDQLWAEAVWCFREWVKEKEAGVKEDDQQYRWWLTPSEQLASDEENSIYQAENPMEADITMWVSQQKGAVKPMTVTEVAKRVLSMTNEMLARDVSLIQRVGKSLKSLGWKKNRTRVLGRRCWVYEPPDLTSEK